MTNLKKSKCEKTNNFTFTKLKNSNFDNSKPEFITKPKFRENSNSNFDKNHELQLLQNLTTQITTKFKTLILTTLKTSNGDKISDSDKTQKLK